MKPGGTAGQWSVASSDWAAFLDVAEDLGVDPAATYVYPWDPNDGPSSLPRISEGSVALLLLKVGDRGGYMFRVRRDGDGFEILGARGSALGKVLSAADMLSFMRHASGLSAAHKWAEFSAEMDRRTLD